MAQTSLAQILLRLNTGLVSIISSFIGSERNKLDLDYRSLTNLSERSCMETCRALRELHRRSMYMHLPPAIESRAALYHDMPATPEEKPISKHRRREPKPAHSPTIASGPTLARITIQNSSKPSQIALVKPAARRKKSSSTSSLSKTSSKTTLVACPSPPPPPEPRKAPATQHSRVAPEKPTVRRKQSQPISTFPDPPQTRVPARHPQRSPDPPRVAPNLPAASTTMQESFRRRAHVPTYYSIASNGTKIGEIPLEKWAEKFDFEAMAAMNREAELNGWPLVPAGPDEKKKSRGGFFYVFRRKER
nr:hypothetical protein CFP56_69686 [Quercus suber]